MTELDVLCSRGAATSPNANGPDEERAKTLLIGARATSDNYSSRPEPQPYGMFVD